MSPLSILILGENSVEVSKLKQSLEDYGCQVVQTEANAKALAAAARKYFDLIVLNITEPQVIGSELGNRLKNHHPELVSIPTVILTTRAQIKEVINKFELPPPVSYLAKDAYAETRILQIIQEIHYLTERYM
jgi:CheY-like chemotaxis protein